MSYTYKIDNAKVTERMIEQIKQNEMLDRIADKVYVEYLKSENKRLRDENKYLRKLIAGYEEYMGD